MGDMHLQYLLSKFCLGDEETKINNSAEDEQIDNWRRFCSSTIIWNQLCKKVWILQPFLKSRFGRQHWMVSSHRKQILLLCTGEQFTMLRSPVLKCSPELTCSFTHIWIKIGLWRWYLDWFRKNESLWQVFVVLISLTMDRWGQIIWRWAIFSF